MRRGRCRPRSARPASPSGVPRATTGRRRPGGEPRPPGEEFRVGDFHRAFVDGQQALRGELVEHGCNVRGGVGEYQPSRRTRRLVTAPSSTLTSRSSARRASARCAVDRSVHRLGARSIAPAIPPVASSDDRHPPPGAALPRFEQGVREQRQRTGVVRGAAAARREFDQQQRDEVVVDALIHTRARVRRLPPAARRHRGGRRGTARPGQRPMERGFVAGAGVEVGPYAENVHPVAAAQRSVVVAQGGEKLAPRGVVAAQRPGFLELIHDDDVRGVRGIEFLVQCRGGIRAGRHQRGTQFHFVQRGNDTGSQQ